MMKKRALITGSAQGIGRCLAEGFAKAGYEVFALDLQQTTFKQEQIHFFQADLKNEEEVKRCFRKIRNDYGQIHVLINNGAVSQFHKPIDEIAMEEFDRVIHTNLRGAFLCCRNTDVSSILHQPGFIRMRKTGKHTELQKEESYR